MMTQTKRVMRHLNDFGSITSLEAMRDYGIMRLASRISELRKSGVPITKEMVEGENRYGEKTRYARYRMVSEEGDNENKVS